MSNPNDPNAPQKNLGSIGAGAQRVSTPALVRLTNQSFQLDAARNAVVIPRAEIEQAINSAVQHLGAQVSPTRASTEVEVSVKVKF
ncbi:MAG TPA: hypothetical protein VFS21_18090 [Roseiflexaceae bacterium]|nr:hypothetical protein [Roseiflexaceae bacterium]